MPCPRFTQLFSDIRWTGHHQILGSTYQIPALVDAIGSVLSSGSSLIRIIPSIRYPKVAVINRFIAALSFVSILIALPASAAVLEIIAPDIEQSVSVDLGKGEAGDLIIYLKSFGDMVGGYKVTVMDSADRQVGKNISDVNGTAKFTNLPPGRFRVFAEKKMNDRGGISTVSIGDLKLTKIRKK